MLKQPGLGKFTEKRVAPPARWNTGGERLTKLGATRLESGKPAGKRHRGIDLPATTRHSRPLVW